MNSGNGPSISTPTLATFWDFSEIVHSQPYEQVVDATKRMDEIPEWFKGSRLNFAENLLRYNDDSIALIGTGEGKAPAVKVTYRQLNERVARAASALRQAGVTIGDRVVGYIPNCIEAVELMLAVTSIGAIWSSTSPDFGITGVLERFSQINPKLIFSVNAVHYNGKVHDHMGKLHKVVDGLGDLERVVIIPFVESVPIDLASIPKAELYDTFLSLSEPDPALKFEQLPFNHPLYVMFSSGTTGVPKCMVHSAGGTLIQHLKEHRLHADLSRSDVLFYYTTTGWMMWNWLVSGLASGATVVLYDGSPFIPTPVTLWDLSDEIGITIFGTGAKWLAALEDKHIHPIETHKLTSIRTILSTGSPLKPESFDYVYTHIKKDVLLGSITGGTDIISCFAGSNPAVPVIRGEIQSRNLGMKMESWDEGAHPVFDESGELVCTVPFPSMPVSFWNDADGSKYRSAYFGKYDGVWAHGDFVQISSATGGIWMLGRSDGTLNPAGVRFGSAEIYHVVEPFPEIADSLCVSQKMGADERVILFVLMNAGHEFNDQLKKRVAHAIREQLSARHVPAIIMQTTAIPYTINGKKVEVAVKRIIAGEKVLNRASLANPESLDLYASIPQLAL
eukprot:Opistho-2@18761